MNVNGGLESKLEEGMLFEEMNKYDIFMFCESWTRKCSYLDVNNFSKPFCKHRKRKKLAKSDSGGIVCYFKNNIVGGVTDIDWDFEDGMCFKLDKNFFKMSKDLFLHCVYMRSNALTREDVSDGLNCYDVLCDQVASVSEHGGVIVAGDFNARLGYMKECLINELGERDSISNEVHEFVNPSFDSESLNERKILIRDIVANDMSVERANADTKTNEYGNRLVQLCMTCDLIILNGRAGSDRGKGELTFCNHRGESAIDYVLCDKCAMYKIKNFDVHDVNCLSDHCLLSFEICIDECIEISDNDVPIYSEKARWDSDKTDEYKEFLLSEELSARMNNMIGRLEKDVYTGCLDDDISEFSSILVTAGSGHIRKKRVGGKVRLGRTQGDWFDGECKQAREVFREGQIRFNENRSEDNRIWMCTKRSDYRRICRAKKREYCRREAERLVDISNKDAKLFWREIRKIKVEQTDITLNFHEHFSRLAGGDSKLGEEGSKEVDGESGRVGIDSRNEVLDRPINMDELDKAIKMLKNNKSSGHDLIINEFIVNASLQAKYVILLLFNCVLKLEYFPSFWCVGSIVPVFKRGDKNDVNNYRGITLLSCFGKLFTRILNNRINDWVESESILTEAQFGFRKGRCTSDCLFILHGLIEILFARGKRLYCCFIDYEKAYDYLDRTAVLFKLLKSGVSSKCVNIFKSMYDKLKLEMRGNKNEQYFESNRGLLQGETTSPILFSLFVNDLEHALSSGRVGTNIQDILIKFLMFADDTVIFSESREGLQEGLNSLYRYCTKWGLTVNVDKTKIVVFRKGGRLSVKDIWYYGNLFIQIVDSYKYLGFNLKSSGSFSNCIQDLTNSARRALFAVKCCFSRNPELSPSLQLKLFSSLVEPILNYGSEVWGLSKCDPIEKMHISFLKSILCVKSSTPNCFIYGELGVFPLLLRRQLSVIKFWLKLIRNDNNTSILSRAVYSEMLAINIENPSVVTWASLVKSMLCKIGLGIFWEKQHVIDEKYFVRLFRQRIHDIYLQDWHAEVSLTSNNRLFKIIKDNFCFEPYLSLNNKAFRTAITRIRLSSHVFMIERARWNRRIPEVKERLCKVCNVVENEFHCLIECPRFTNERKGCIPDNVLSRVRSEEDFYIFLRTENECEIKKLGLLCYRVQKTYKRELFQDE